jgi:RNase H-like domain found in reverse transcriptase
VTTDFSCNGVGGMLSQIVEGVEYPVMFCSRNSSYTEVNYASTNGEALAILFALHRFAFVLYG